MERTRDYFSKFLKPGTQTPAAPSQDNVGEFHRSWIAIKNTLEQPDERQLRRGIESTDVPVHLQTLADLLVSESTRAEEGATGQCLEYLLKHDVLGTLVKLSEADRPSGIQAQVLRTVQSMVILMDEQFLVHSAVHKAVLRLLRSCVGDDLQEQLDNRNKKVMGAAGDAVRTSPSEYEEDLVNLLCILCSRIRTFRELLMIFFHDKHWFHSDPLFSVEEEEEEDDDRDDGDHTPTAEASTGDQISQSSIVPQATSVSTPPPSLAKKSEYEFLLFNYLLRFVHREGKTGEFARAGLLFLMDVAMSPYDTGHRMTPEDDLSSSSSSGTVAIDPIKEAALSLAEYILDGDFSEVLAAGLGAVYSLLPSKLEISSPKPTEGAESGSMVLGCYGADNEGLDDTEAARPGTRGISKEDSESPEFKAQLDHFLRLLEFLEDVFRRNISTPGTFDESTLVGSAIVDSILDAVRRVFMENILYPSILECSESDGSAVAVMSYIDVMIRTLEHGQLAQVLVSFLMTEDNDDLPRSPHRTRGILGGPPQLSKATKAQKLRRRRSSAMMLLEMDAPGARRQSEYFTSMGRFTLKDLLLTNLRSKDEASAAAALQLLQSLLYRHNNVCVERLLVVALDPQATSFPEPLATNPCSSSSPALVDDDESEKFIYPGAQIESEPELKPSGPIFAQPNTTLATHEREMSLYLNLVSRIDPLHVSDSFSTGYSYYLRDAASSIQGYISFIPDLEEHTLKSGKHRLDPNDPLLSLVLERLRRFLYNKPVLNMALTGVLATLAYDPNRSLAGWLTFGQTDQHATPLPAANAPPRREDDGDDRSVDCIIEQWLASDSQSLPASSMNDQSRPVVFTILQGLVGQLERYRQTIDDFDKYLSERRQGLLFSENLTDALALAWDLDDPTAFAQLRPSVSHSSPAPATPPPKSTPKKSNSFVSFLTPRKSKNWTSKAAPTQTPAGPSSPPKGMAATPFGSHYQQTGSVIIEPSDAPLPSTSPWTPARSRKYIADDEDDIFSSGWGSEQQPVSHQEEEKVKIITLSQLLDNVVILEESIKELAAIIHARKSLGIDGVRYV